MGLYTFCTEELCKKMKRKEKEKMGEVTVQKGEKRGERERNP